MDAYRLTWISGNLAVGGAPLSYDDLRTIREQGVDAIVNLCAEYCDLHDIERGSGFEVFYLPVHDDSAPAMEELERALDWLDEALYLGKKALVHCRHGIGRTGTFIAAYLLRRGFGLKRAEAALKKIRSSPSSFPQWRLLRRYGKEAGELTVSEPSLSPQAVVDLGPFFADYERIVAELEKSAPAAAPAQCGREHDACCHAPVQLTLAEAACLNYRLNRGLTREQRSAAIRRALEPGSGSGYVCPLSVDRKCLAFAFRPVACRLFVRDVAGASPGSGPASSWAQATLLDLSQRLFCELYEKPGCETTPLFRLADVVSGRFVQQYFELLTKGAADAP